MSAARIVQEFYIAYYGRPADPAGLDFWVGQLGTSNDFGPLVNAFGTSAENTEFNAGKTNTQIIEGIYQQLFGRAADAAGLANYLAEIAAGRATVQDISRRILDGATNADRIIIQNKQTVADAFTAALRADPEAAAEYSGVAAAAASRTLVSSVDATAASVTAAQAQAVTITGTTTVTLTTGADTVPGTAGRDKITGGIAALASSNTLQVNDQIDGGGGRDTLELGIAADFAGFSGGGFLKNVEVVKLTPTATVTNGATFTAKGVTGVQQYDLLGHVNLASVESTSTRINISSISTAQTASVGFIDEAVVGSSTALTLGVSGLGSVNAAGTPTTVTLTTSGVEALTLDATGTLAVVGIGSTGVTSLKATGSGSLRVAATNTGVKSVDASAMTGAFDVDLQAATNVTSVKGGSGNDTFRIDNASITATAVIDGGTGTDTLRIDATGANMTVAPKMTGVEVIRIGSVGNDVTFSLGDTTGVETISISKEAGASLTSSFTGLGANAAKIEIEAEASSPLAHTTSVENTSSASVSLKVSSAAVSTSTIQSTTDSVTLTKATSVDVSLPKFSRWDSGTIIANEATAVTISGDGDLGQAGVITLNLPKATTLTLDQTDTTQGWTFLVDTAATSTLKTLNLSSKSTTAPLFGNSTELLSELQVLNISTLAGGLDFTVGGGNGNIVKASTISVAGSGSSASFKAGDIGSATLAYGVSITASGLQNTTTGLTLGDVKVGTGQNIVLDIGKVTGPATIGEVSAASATAGTVTINASGIGAQSNAQNLVIANNKMIQGGTVSIDVTGAKGTVSLASGNSIKGNAVTVLASTAEGAVTLGTIEAKNSVVFEGRLAQAISDQVITVGSGSTAFTADLKGSILGDTFTINSGQSTQTSIKVTGDLKDGTDTVNVNALQSTASGGLTIDISGLSGADTSTLRGALGTKNTIIAGAGADTIHGGTKADLLTGGGGKDVFFLNNIADTGTVSLDALATSSKFASGKSVSTVELDVITDFTAGDTLTISGFTAAAIATSGRVVLGTDANTVASTGSLLNGTYSSSANTFTTSSTGLDSLYLYPGASSVTHGIVLVGFATGFAAASGGLTGSSGVTGITGTST